MPHDASAPTLGTRSPPKPLSTTSSRDSSNKSERLSHHPARPADDSQNDDAALARAKQREQQATTIPTTNLANVRSRLRTTAAAADNPDPTNWPLKGTSVQAANAIHQAAMALNPNDSWASSSRTVVPRSTSVEYEKETQSTSTRRLKPPPSRNAPAPPTAPPPSRSAGLATTKLLAKQASLKFVPDSEGEDAGAGEASRGRQERAKTPLESVLDLAKRTAFYLRQRSTEPEVGQQPSEQSQNGYQRNDESYDYAAEDREYREQSEAAAAATAAAKGRKANNAAAAHKRNAGRISVDNRAYRPTQSDLEQSDEDDVSDDGKRRRRKGKKNMIGPLTTLPVVGQERKRRRRKSTKADGGDQEGEEDGEGEEEEDDSASEDRASPPVRRPAHARLISFVDSYFDRIAFCPFISATFPAPRTTKTPI